jgi:hypothetical protein
VIRQGICNQKWLAIEQKKLARRPAAPYLARRETNRRLEPNARPVKKADERIRCIADRARHARDLIERGVGKRVKNLILQKSLEPLGLVVLHGCGT